MYYLCILFSIIIEVRSIEHAVLCTTCLATLASAHGIAKYDCKYLHVYRCLYDNYPSNRKVRKLNVKSLIAKC